MNNDNIETLSVADAETLIPRFDAEIIHPEDTIPSKILNRHKSDYGNNPSLFLGEDPGVLDTVTRKFEDIWLNYKEMKSLDWDEVEFEFASCNLPFKMVSPYISNKMRKTLMLQWEGDSIASRTIVPVMYNFINNAPLQCAWGRIGDNENLHATTYSEIIRLSFDDPQAVLQETIQIRENFARLATISRVMGESYKRSHLYALGMVEDDQETYNHALLFVCALLMLERIQFMASFAVTFAIAEIEEAGGFQPIVKAVQKICQDELEVHVQLDKLVLANEFRTERGQVFLEQHLGTVREMIREVRDSEIEAARWLMAEDERELPTMSTDDLIAWIELAAADVAAQFGLEADFEVPETIHVLDWIGGYLDINKTQSSNQEQQNNQYKTNIMKRDDEGVVFDFDF